VFSLFELLSYIRRFRDALKVGPDAPFIARRMFITNSIDSILSSLGVNIGAYSSDLDPKIMILAVLGGSLSLSIVSGFIGVFVSERAERVRELKELEKKLGARLKSSLYAKSITLIPLYVALWSSIGMLVFPLIIVIPYVLALINLLKMWEAFVISIGITLTSLTVIGAYLGFVTGEKIQISALRTLGLGLLALISVTLFKLFFKTLIG